MKMYALEGNIGVGKSTFLNLIKRYCSEIEIAQEPVKNWINNQGSKSLLEVFYSETNRWAYTMETFTMVSRSFDYLEKQAIKKANLIMERSVFSGHYCFAKNDFENGYLDEIEWEVYLKWVDFFLFQNCKPPSGFIYLRADPEVCFERMKVRNRKGEETVSLEYLKQIHKQHEKLLIEKDGLHSSIAAVPVLTLDCSKEFESNLDLLQCHINQLRNFLKQGVDKRFAQIQ
jgi:deoxyadenosine/deoxycytidine kinase